MTHVIDGIADGVIQIETQNNPYNLYRRICLRNQKQQDSADGNDGSGNQQPWTGFTLPASGTINDLSHDDVCDSVDDFGSNGKHRKKQSSPQPAYLQNIGVEYQLFGLDKIGLSTLREHRENGMPMVMANDPGLFWIAAFTPANKDMHHHIYAIGPVFVEDISQERIDAALEQYSLIGAGKQAIREQLLRLPVLSITRFYDYGLMLHYCITGEKISFSEFQYPEAAKNAQQQPNHAENIDSHGTWAMEQELLRLIEEGNLDYKEQAFRMVSTGSLGKLGNGDPVRNLKNLVIIFTALCTRAAIRGGLPPEIAYTLSDKYISAIEAALTLSEVAEINAASAFSTKAV